jgi:hypothetical protein
VLSTHNDRVGSGFFTLSLDVTANLGQERTRLTSYLNLGMVAYLGIPGQAVQRDTSLGKSSFVGNYVYSSNSVSLGYEWTPRISTATSYTLLHSFGGKLRLGGGLYYAYNHTGALTNTDEHDLQVTAIVSYLLTRALALEANYTFTGVKSDITSRTYYRDTAFVGVAFTF